jgi:hypothetical protein
MPKIEKRDVTSWFDGESKKWLDIMNDDNCACLRPMIFFKSTKFKDTSMMVMLPDGMKFSEFVGKNVPAMIKSAKDNGDPLKGIAYFFHTKASPDDACPEKTNVNMVAFSAESDEIFGRVHALNCINKGKDGKDIVVATRLKEDDFPLESFDPAMRPLFTNPFLPARDRP